MKKFLKVVVALLFVVCFSVVVNADDVFVTLNGEYIDFADQPATIVEGRTMVPLRVIFEALGATVEWDQTTKTVTSHKDNITISLTIGSNILYRNGQEVLLDVSAQILNGRTMVPARAIAEAYGVEVQWDKTTKTVILMQNVNVADFSTVLSQYYQDVIEKADPLDDNIIAYYVKGNDKESCFRVPVKLKPEIEYDISFDLYLDTDSNNNVVYKGNGNVLLNYGTSYKESYSHEILKFYAGHSWSHVSTKYSTPPNINTNEVMELIIVVNPVNDNESNNFPVNYYLKNIVVKPVEKEENVDKNNKPAINQNPTIECYPGTIIPTVPAVIGNANYYTTDVLEIDDAIVYTYTFDEWDLLLNDLPRYRNALLTEFGWKLFDKEEKTVFVTWYYYKGTTLVSITANALDDSIRITYLLDFQA